MVTLAKCIKKSLEPRRFRVLWLSLIAALQYLPTLFYSITKFDDHFFIYSGVPFNANVTNLFSAFHRTVFFTGMPFYRPILLQAFILNYQFCGLNLEGYHLVNITLHVIAVLSLYSLLQKLGITSFQSFLLSLFFAVHPALTATVAWIPGRNDSILAIFSFLFFINALNVAKRGKIKDFLCSGIFLLSALFTKETAVALIPVAVILITVFSGIKLFSKKNLLQFLVWAFCLFIWLRMSANFEENNSKHIRLILYNLYFHFPSLLFNFGKIFIPVNLGVYPVESKINLIYGFASLILIITIVLLNKNKNYLKLVSSVVIFILLLLPTFVNINGNSNFPVLEHRLYLPFLGICLLVANIFFNDLRLSNRIKLFPLLPVFAFLSILNFKYQKNYQNPSSFWSNAVSSSDSSIAPLTMLAFITEDKTQAFCLFRRAFQLNPDQKYLNLRYGIFLQRNDSILESEKYLVTELGISNSYDTYFYLAKVAACKKMWGKTIYYTQQFMRNDPFYDTATEQGFILSNRLTEEKNAESYLKLASKSNNIYIKSILNKSCLNQ